MGVKGRSGRPLHRLWRGADALLVSCRRHTHGTVAMTSPPPAREPDALERALVVVGRVALASLFVLGGVAKVLEPELYLALMDEAGIEPARPLLTLVTALELGFGLWLAAGLRHAFFPALALAAHTVLINALVHRFWEHGGGERVVEIALFSKNLAIVGGLLYFAGAELCRARERQRVASAERYARDT